MLLHHWGELVCGIEDLSFKVGWSNDAEGVEGRRCRGVGA